MITTPLRNMTSEQLQRCKDDIVYYASNWYFRHGDNVQLLPWMTEVLRTWQKQPEVTTIYAPSRAGGKELAQDIFRSWQKFVKEDKPIQFLHLSLTEHWFDYIMLYDKDEEYRLATDFYRRRFEVSNNFGVFKLYTHIVLHDGYTLEALVYPIISIRKGCDGREDWGAEPGIEYYITKFDKR